METEAANPGPAKEARAPKPRVKPIDRSQTMFRVIDVEQLIEPDHPARAIWEFVGRLDLTRFYKKIQAVEGVPGRQAWDPRLLISIWVYAYSRGISSGRELSRRCEYEPAFQWLAALGCINYHTLCDFRSTYDAELPELFTQVLGVLSSEGLVNLERVMHDGTKIKASASKSSFARRERLKEHLKAAREQVEALKDWKAEETAGQKAARQRAVRERQTRVEQALKELDTLQEKHEDSEVRVSHTDPQARVMKQPNGGFAPSYNVQLSTEAAHQVIVGAGVTQNGNDWSSLVPAMAEVEKNCGAKPKQVVVDAGFTTRKNVMELSAQGVEMIGSLRDLNAGGQLERRGIAPEFHPKAFEYNAQEDSYRCPMGTVLKRISTRKKRSAQEHIYRADCRACEVCPFQRSCCGQEGEEPRSVYRTQEPKEMEDFIKRMRQDEAKEIYRQRAGVAEFTNAWIKEKLGVRQFRLRGLVKAGLEVIWACLTYNIQTYIRLIAQQQTLQRTANP